MVRRAIFLLGIGGKRLRLEVEKWVRLRKGVPVAGAWPVVMQVNGGDILLISLAFYQV